MPRAAESTHVLRRLLRIAWEYRVRCCAVLGLQLLVLALTVIALGWSGVALDVVHQALVPTAATPRFPFGAAPPGAWSAFELVVAIAAAVVCMGMLRAALGYAYTVAVADLVQGHLVPRIRAQVYEKLQQLSFRFYDRHASGSLLNRVTSDVQSLRSFIDMVLIQALVMLLALGVYGAYMLSKHALLTLACLASTPGLWFLTTRFSRRVIPAHDRSRARLDELVLGVSEAVHGVQVIKGFAAESSALAELASKNASVRDSQREIFRQVSRYTPMVDLLIQSNLIVLLSYGGMLVVHGRLTLGDLVVFAGLLQQFSAQVMNLSTIVRLGRPGASEAEIIAAAEALGVTDLIEALPNGWRTRVGERGVGLSLGQRQIVCFTRAMLANPRLVLLDEATSAVDAVAERRLQAALELLLVGRTSFIVAHRLSTIRKADVVLVLEGGRIVERGDHTSLLARDGAYRRLYREFMATPAPSTWHAT